MTHFKPDNPNTAERHALSDRIKSWDREQSELQARRVGETDIPGMPTTNETDEYGVPVGLSRIGGVDVSFLKEDSSIAVAALAVLSYPGLDVLHEEYLEVKMDVPYIAGYLAFREMIPLRTLIERVRSEHPELMPQVILVDGSGTLHPKCFGLACHLGVIVDVPTIGVAKNFLQIDDGLELSMTVVKERTKQELSGRGDRFLLQGKSGKEYGDAVVTSEGATNPLFISPGHRVSREMGVRIVLACARFRVPEPIRAADGLSRRYIRERIHPEGTG